MFRNLALVVGCALLAGCLVANDKSAPPPTATTTAADSQPGAADSPTPRTIEQMVAEADAQQSATRIEGFAAASTAEITLKILTFDQIQKLIAGHKGKVVVMDCWSTSCDPCVKEFPNLVALHKKYGPEKVACISFSFDYEGLARPEEVHPSVLKFLKEKQATFDNVMSSEEAEVIYKKLELASIPAVYVYDQQGKAKRFDNESIKKPEEAFTYKDIEVHVAKLLDVTKPE